LQNPAKAKNFYRKDAKNAKKQHKSLDYLPRALVTLAYAGVHSYFPLRPMRLRGENALIFPLIRALVTLAYAGVHSCLAVNMDFRTRENDGKGFFPLFSVQFRVNPWQMLLFAANILAT